MNYDNKLKSTVKPMSRP